MPRSHGITRQEILASIKASGAMTAEDLAQALGISQVAVRQHLAALEAENMIAVSVERRGLGRPAHRYRLTPQGDETFPRAYDLLANALLDELRAWQGEAAVNELLERRRKRFFNTLQPYMKDKSLPERLRALADALDEQGFMAHVSELPAGQYRLEKRNCALHAVARKNPSLCCYGEAELYARLLSQVNVEREKTILDGHHACTFCICPGPSRAVLDSDLK